MDNKSHWNRLPWKTIVAECPEINQIFREHTPEEMVSKWASFLFCHLENRKSDSIITKWWDGLSREKQIELLKKQEEIVQEQLIGIDIELSKINDAIQHIKNGQFSKKG